MMTFFLRTAAQTATADRDNEERLARIEELLEALERQTLELARLTDESLKRTITPVESSARSRVALRDRHKTE